jgi:RND superfamily putative drug exporter
MFELLGHAVGRRWPLVLIAWIALLAVCVATAPHSLEVTQDGEFVFLPTDSPSRVAETLYRRAFPAAEPAAGDEEESRPAGVQQNPLGSNVVIIVRRTDRPGGLTDEDKRFVEEILRPELEEIARTVGRGYVSSSGAWAPAPENADDPVVQGVWSMSDRRLGPLLTSPDDRATLIVMELETEFLDRGNALFLREVERLVRDVTHKQRWGDKFQIAGLDLAISGSATVGRDMLIAEEASASSTDWFTKVLVILLLLMIYRAPLMALIPLLTVGMAVEVTLHLLRILAGYGIVGLFNGIEVYVTVVVYGSGVDYCLFLIARYKEELDNGRSLADAVAESVLRVGVALATSAGTSIVGIGMLGFAEFGKFRQAGIAISFGLLVVLLAALSFTPALMRLFDRWAFWPDVRREKIAPDAHWPPRFSFFSLLQEQRWLDRLWQSVADFVAARPATVLVACLAIMSPFAVVALRYHDHLSYGLLSDLQSTETSVVGAKAIQKHFAAGVTGPTTTLLYHPDLDLPAGAAGLSSGERFAETITERLKARGEELTLVDIRSQKHPLGITEKAEDYLREQGQRGPLGGGTRLIRLQAARTYLSQIGELAGDVIRLDLLFNIDPFSRDSIDQLSRVEQAIRDALPEAYAVVLQHRHDQELESQWESGDDTAAGDTTGSDEVNSSAATSAVKAAGPGPLDPEVLRAEAQALARGTQIYSIGPTAGIRDLKTVTDRDQLQIYVLVVVSVYLVLIILLSRPAVCGYLIVTVVFSYFVTLGVTYTLFWSLDPQGFAGLDWKVPIFLFTILIAMGEDYNILLMTRVIEEQRTHGPVQGVLVALSRTGSIITSCGIIMGGTFATLASGYLQGMVQLGFSLAFGVFLDTFVVRPILVPTYLLLLHSGRFGRLGPWLGATVPVSTEHTTPQAGEPIDS